jgi:hypothetical protein
MTSKSGGVKRNPRKSSKSPITQAIDYFLCWRTARGAGASSLTPTGSWTASIPKQYDWYIANKIATWTELTLYLYWSFISNFYAHPQGPAHSLTLSLQPTHKHSLQHFLTHKSYIYTNSTHPLTYSVYLISCCLVPLPLYIFPSITPVSLHM